MAHWVNHIFRFWPFAILVALLSACAADTGGSRTVAPSLAVMFDPITGREVVTTSREAYGDGLFSAENIRETVFSGNTQPRLANQSAGGQTGFIDTRSINAGPTNRITTTDFEGVLSDRPTVAPLNQQQIEGALWQPRYSENPPSHSATRMSRSGRSSRTSSAVSLGRTS